MSDRAGLCGCGCGSHTAPSTRTYRRRGIVRGQPTRFCPGHHPATDSPRGKCSPAWKGGRYRITAGYIAVNEPGHPHANKDGYVLEHLKVACEALGRPLPKGAQVHHVNENKADNRPDNLVICQDAATHKAIHRRMRARRECGNPRWWKCERCHQWDAPENLVVPKRPGRSAYHPKCAAEWQRTLSARRKQAQGGV